MDDAIDSVDERMSKLRDRIENDHETPADWFDAFIEMLDQEINDFATMETAEFVEGMGQARHSARQFQLTYLDKGTCHCDEPFAEAVADGEWKCANCDATMFADLPRGER